MKGTECPILGVMDGSDKQFIIPVYQRNYDWKIENCKQLFNDLVKVIKQNRKSHFFGSIVSAYDYENGSSSFLIIDGQQRLTTLSLLLLAIYNILKKGLRTSETNPALADKIYDAYLTNRYQQGEKRIRLKPVKGDRVAFNSLFSDPSEHIKDSNLTTNYNYFYSCIQSSSLTIDELISAIQRLEIINITLTPDDNPQLIFESLNSTGVALSEGDKIRNFILMGLNTKDQERLYEAYWNKIEHATKFDVSLFIRDYLSVKTLRIPAMSRVYYTFKSYVEEKNIDIEPLLQKLLSYAKYYETLLVGQTPDKELNACIARLNRLETTVTRPFFLEVLQLHDEGTLSLAEVKEIFLTTEHYLFRRMICELATNALNKIFVSLHREIIRYDGTDTNYLEKFKYALTAKTEYRRFPGDEEFKTALATRPIYLMNSKNKIYILERFENYGTTEVQDVYQHCEEGIYSIEHIMPQTLSAPWKEALGPDYESIHKQWLHRIANLTLTAYNTQYSNAVFAQKRDIPNGFSESHLYLNKWIAQQDHWGLEQLQARNELLTSRALQIWRYPTTSFLPSEKELDACSLEEDIDLTGRNIAKFVYNDTEYPVDSWSNMMMQLLRLLHATDQSVLTHLACTHDGTDSLQSLFSSDASTLHKPIFISEDIYFEQNTSTALKISSLRKLFNAFHIDQDELLFYLKDTTSAETDDLAPRHELRIKYWAFALPLIKAANQDNTNTPIFQRNDLTKQHWVSSQFGIKHITISCIATLKEASISLYLGHPNMAYNKKWFDNLYRHKAEIEAKLSIALEWKRLDNRIASRIDYTITNVSLKNEDDWKAIATFHAEWSRKIYDTFLPYLQAL